MPEVRSYLVRTRNFGDVVVRAASNGRARIIVARSYCWAGYGDVRDGLREIVSCRLAPHMAGSELVDPRGGPEGLCHVSPTVLRGGVG